jgi:hypothetical protein
MQRCHVFIFVVVGANKKRAAAQISFSRNVLVFSRNKLRQLKPNDHENNNDDNDDGNDNDNANSNNRNNIGKKNFCLCECVCVCVFVCVRLSLYGCLK